MNRSIGGNRWGGAAPASDDEARSLLLDAAATCFDAQGPIRATVDDIARAASVHRTTVYKYFPNRAAIVAAVLMREAHELMSEAAACYDAPGSFASRFTAALEHVAVGVQQSGLLRRLFDPQAVDLVVHATSASEEFREIVARSLTGPVVQAATSGELRSDLEVDEVVEWLGSVSLMLLGESFRNEKLDVLEAVRKYVLPGVCTGREIARTK